MRPRYAVPMGVIAAASLAVGLTIAVAAQAPSPPSSAAKTWDAKTPWGDPDLQGLWDYRTITPLERPAQFGNKAVLTDAEVAEIQRARKAQDEAKLQRKAAPTEKGKNVDLAEDGSPGFYQQFWLDFGENTAGNRTSLIINPPNGRIPPLTPAAQKRLTDEAEKRKMLGVQRQVPTPGGWLDEMGTSGTRVRCLYGYTAGPPFTPGGYNNNIRLWQGPGYAAILNEQIHSVRMIPLDGRPRSGVRQWMGESRGHWEGNTLVVETANFYVYSRGLDVIGSTISGYSERTRLIEKFTRTDKDTMAYEFTVDDPENFTQKWTANIPMKNSSEMIFEFACHEGDYAIYNILSGIRTKEEAAGKRMPAKAAPAKTSK